MGKVYQFDVEQIPLVDTITELSIGDRKRYGIICRTGIYNAYRTAFALGQGASRRDKTFNKTLGIHTCCGSKVAWRHKTACHLLKFEDELTTPKAPLTEKES